MRIGVVTGGRLQSNAKDDLAPVLEASDFGGIERGRRRLDACRIVAAQDLPMVSSPGDQLDAVFVIAEVTSGVKTNMRAFENETLIDKIGERLGPKSWASRPWRLRSRTQWVPSLPKN